MLQTPSPPWIRVARLGTETITTSDPRSKQHLDKRKPLFQNILCSIKVVELTIQNPTEQ